VHRFEKGHGPDPRRFFFVELSLPLLHQSPHHDSLKPLTPGRIWGDKL